MFVADTKGKFGSPKTSLPFVDKHSVHWMAQSPPPPVTDGEPVQGPAQQWVNGFEGEHAERDWADEFAARFTDGADPNQWMEEFSSDMDAQQAAREAGWSSDATKRCKGGGVRTPMQQAGVPKPTPPSPPLAFSTVVAL